MSIRVALHHRTQYKYDRLTELGPHVVRLRPAPHCRTPIRAYSLKISPAGPLSQLAAGSVRQLPRAARVQRAGDRVRRRGRPAGRDDGHQSVRLLPGADAEIFPFSYYADLLKDLMPFLHVSPVMDDSPLAEYVRTIDRTPRKTIDFLVELNQKLKRRRSAT